MWRWALKCQGRDRSQGSINGVSIWGAQGENHEGRWFILVPVLAGGAGLRWWWWKTHSGVSQRLNQESLQTCQEEMLRLEDEVYREAEEKALLREALERTRAELGQEKRLNRAARQRKVGALG